MIPSLKISGSSGQNRSVPTYRQQCPTFEFQRHSSRPLATGCKFFDGKLVEGGDVRFYTLSDVIQKSTAEEMKLLHVNRRIPGVCVLKEEMIRGRKEGSTYATWFIGFDHDDTFGLTPFSELPPQSPRTPVHNKPVSRATSLETLLPPSQSRDTQVAQRSVTPATTQTSSQISRQTSTQTTEEAPTQNLHQVSLQTTTHTSTEASTETADPVVNLRLRTSAHTQSRPKSQDFDTYRDRRRREKDTSGLYKEAFDGARRAEEFKFRVKFDKLIGDLHVAIEEKTQNGLTRFASPSYGDMMLTYKERVKELLKHFTQRLQLAYESFGTEDTPENTEQKVKQNVSKFIEELIGETIDLTSDEAVSDLSSLSDDSTSDQNSFENLIAQAVVSKLLENHRKEVNETLWSSNSDSFKKSEGKDQGTETEDNVILRLQGDYLSNYNNIGRNQNNSDNVDGQNFHSKQQRKNNSVAHNGSSLTSHDLFNYKSNLIPDDAEEEIDEECGSLNLNDKESDSLKLTSEKSKLNVEINTNNKVNFKNDKSHSINGTVEPIGINGTEFQNGGSDEETDIVKEFEQLKEFVKKTRTSARSKVKAIPFDDSGLCEAKEETFLKAEVDRDEKREEFHTRYSVFDHINNWEQPLPDFSQFDNIDFSSDEIDPDLLSMNLAIIPEETEEELEQEEEEDEQNQWKTNWLFKGKGVSPYENMGKKTVNRDPEGSLYMMVPRPDANYAPKIGNRDIDQLSDFSEHDLLGRGDLDGSDEDEENTFYANTSKELARISVQRNQPGNFRRQSSGSHSDNSDFDGRMARRKAQQLYERTSLDYVDNIDIPGPIVEPSKQELKLLQDLVPADNDDPKFVLPPESVTVQEGEPVKFSCKVAGTASVDVFWYREGEDMEELEESEDVEITSNGDKHSIVLYNTSKQMEGQYMCIALNEKGKAIQYLVVTVKDNKQELKKPEFLKGLKDVEVTEGQSVKFRVKVKGYPPPRISWYKDRELLKNSKTCRIEKFGNRDYILTIDYASMNDDAEYTVSARNVAGEERMSAQVIVEPHSELPVRRQRISSNTTSGASDSDSDKSTTRRYTASVAGSTSSKGSVQERGNQLHISQLDRKIDLTKVKVDEEVQKMQGVPEKDKTSERRKLITAETLDVLKAADEIIQQEKGANGHYTNDTRNGATATTSVNETTDGDRFVSALSSIPVLNPESFIETLSLPDTLDEFPMLNPGVKTTQVTSVEFTLAGRDQSNNFSDREATIHERIKPEENYLGQTNKINKSHPVVSQPVSVHNQNGTDFKNASVDKRDNSADAVSSVLSDTSSRDLDEIDLALSISRQQLLKEQYSRDFEIPQMAEKKKWTVTLDPFSPQAEVVNKHSSVERTNERTSISESSVTDSSPSSSIRSLRGDNSSQASSRRQSTDSGVSVSSKQKRPAPVHMIGHTTEDEVPESRTEFNTDGSVELPSVNRLKAMFSGVQDEDLGNGSFKRIHSITARNVPKEKLEKLRAASNQKESSSSGMFLEVPGSLPATALQLDNNSSSSLTSSSNVPKVTLKPVPSSVDSVPSHHQKTLQVSSPGTYLDLNPDKDPVLIYPETGSSYIQQHHPHEPNQPPAGARTLTKLNREPQQQQLLNQKPTPAVTKMNVSPSKPPQHQQTRLLVRRVANNDENDNVKKSGPRIRSGCISARAAFWERRIVDSGAVDEEEFPEMVEDDDN